tara:strand:+ start:1440 stop:2906 length:1467 start_codon:yes stop_codon:yes gene_type:complete
MAIYNMPMSVGNAAKTSKTLADVDTSQAQAANLRQNTRAKREEVDDFILGAENRAAKRKADTAQSKLDFENMGAKNEADVAKIQEGLSESLMNTDQNELDTLYNAGGEFLETKAGTPEAKRAFAGMIMNMPQEQQDKMFGEGGEPDMARMRIILSGVEKSKKFRQQSALAEQGGKIQSDLQAEQGDISADAQEDRQRFEEQQFTMEKIVERNELEREFQMKLELQRRATEGAYREAQVKAAASGKPIKQEDVGLKDHAKYATSIYGALEMKNELRDLGMDDAELQAMAMSLATQTKAIWQETNQALTAQRKGYLLSSPETITAGLLEAAISEGRIQDGQYLDPSDFTMQQVKEAETKALIAQEAAADKARETTAGTVKAQAPAVPGNKASKSYISGVAERTFDMPMPPSPRGAGPSAKGRMKAAKVINKGLQTAMKEELTASDNINKVEEKWMTYNKIASSDGFQASVSGMPTNEIVQVLERLSSKGK